ncbi:MAG: hypothetical protein CL424_03080 [Acidimicrobiaceae bacterium]|nr:hypothetical protein [Acidimicrobiaceae bacterium]
MPAETHQHFAETGSEQLIDLLLALITPGGGERPTRDAALADIGLNDEVLRWAFWDAIVEEFGERGSSDVDDPDDLISARTVGDLIDAFAMWLGWATRAS